MPQVPPGQSVTEKWPVLDLGVKPRIEPARWALTIDGAVERAVTLAWDDFMALEQVRDVSDFHCVTTWSKLDVAWVGVRASDLLALAGPRSDARFVMCHAYDGYTTNLPLVECLKPDVLLVHTADARPLPVEHGGPVRMITPQLYAWKGAKWINRIELMTEDKLGFWEERGYSSSAHPWRNDRYS
jgi:DMSO/TMAO reductase YedYZ molybdopterin-dependent catalytic subunit